MGLFTVGAGSHIKGLHHIEGNLDGLQYKHILQNVQVPFVRMLYPDGIIQFWQDHSSIHDSRVVQECLSLQADIRLIDWSPQAPDMNPIIFKLCMFILQFVCPTASMSKSRQNRSYGALFSSCIDPQKFAKQTVNMNKRLQCVNRNIRFFHEICYQIINP
jgi:hypothetical protein